MRIYVYLFFMVLVLFGCVEPFEPEVGSYDSTLVVDGLFSNGESPSTITLSRSFPYSEKKGTPIEGALVVIEDEQGGRHELLETAIGVYQTNPATFKGEVGRKYRLVIKTPDGHPFESDWELMKPAPPIEELYATYEEKVQDDPKLPPLPGVVIYLSTKDGEKNTRYYRWEYEETYQYGLRYPPVIGVKFGDRPGFGQDEVFWITGSEFEGGRCWKTEKSTKILIASTDNLIEDVVEDLPLHFVDNKSSRLYIRYSLLVKQYAIAKAYYAFLKKIEEINQTTGSLFDPIPNEVFGNIRHSEGKNIPVLGYFAVAGVSERRLFVNREDLPAEITAPYGPQCVNDTIGIDFRTLYSRIQVGGKVPYDYHYNDFGDPIGFVLTQLPCARCSATGATNKKPDFW